METMLIMCAGVLVGATVFPARLKVWNSRLQVAMTALLIFPMGVGLGSRPGFLAELGDQPRRELQADGNLRQYLDRLDCRQIQEPVSIPAGVNTGSKERIG